MITQEQQIWLDHLSDTKSIVVVSWDPTCEDKFLQIKSQIQDILGKHQAVKHRGASSLKISGQDEIDIYIPVLEVKYDKTVKSVTQLFGNANSNYPLKRTRFVTEINGKHIDVFVINKADEGWKNSEIFYNYLLSNSLALEEYRKLKEGLSGKSMKEYYKGKIEFINEILARINSGN